MPDKSAYVPTPELELRDETPVSAAFGDVYFSRAGGVAETEHVFLAGNQLPEQWQAPREGGVSPPSGINPFTIAELGFGTGLNFLTTLKRFRETAQADATLHYISIEKYPFTREQLQTLLALQPELASEAAELIAAYPLRLPGLHRIHLPRAVLTLCFGDVADMLQEISTLSNDATDLARVGCHPKPVEQESAGWVSPPSIKINAWFLDGFSPAKNPEMWGDAILTRIGELSDEGTTFATFTAAGNVKRGLEAAGFTVNKMPGFGHKRDMLVGQKGKKESLSPARVAFHGEPAGQGSATKGSESPPSIIILGAGIAGATLARALAERGYRVTVIERGEIARGASGNEAGVLFPPLTKQWGNASAFYFSAYSLMLHQLARWKSAGLCFAGSVPGMLRLPRHAEEEDQLRHMNATFGLDPTIAHWLERDAASTKAGVVLATGGAYFPQGSWLSPRELCNALLRHENILLRENTAAKTLVREKKKWRIILENGESSDSDICCVAAAEESAALLANHNLRLGMVGGQISELVVNENIAPIKTILCRKGYLIPYNTARVAFHGEPLAAGVSAQREGGASPPPDEANSLVRVGYHPEPVGQGSATKGSEGGASPPSIINYLTGATYHREHLRDVTQERHAENLAELAAMLPGWFHGTATKGRSSIRATTPDRLPYIGALEEGLYVSTGHGSRGLLSAPMAAEIIASHISGEPAPLAANLIKAVSPKRYSTSA